MWREAKQEGESIPGLPPCLAGAHSPECSPWRTRWVEVSATRWLEGRQLKRLTLADLQG